MREELYWLGVSNFNNAVVIPSFIIIIYGDIEQQKQLGRKSKYHKRI